LWNQFGGELLMARPKSLPHLFRHHLLNVSLHSSSDHENVGHPVDLRFDPFPEPQVIFRVLSESALLFFREDELLVARVLRFIVIILEL
jgi:hypothetical protein